MSITKSLRAGSSFTKPNLLLCFDAFGTLFNPKNTIAQQYAEVARECGITSFSEDELQSNLLAAIKHERERNRNYGKETGLGATKWWTNVIHKTFTPFIQRDQGLPPSLVPKLMHRFSSSEGYDPEHDLISTLRALRQKTCSKKFGEIVIGVITNSDDRVPGILSSIGLNVSPLRYGTISEADSTAGGEYDIDFHCMSYDVGVGKPDHLIFNAADLMLAHVITARDGQSPSQAELENWQKVHVGDEYAKDVVGATNAGWYPVLLDVDDKSTEIADLEHASSQTLNGLFLEHAIVRVRSIRALVEWLTGSKLETK